MNVIECLRANEHLRGLPRADLDALAFAFVEMSYPDACVLIRRGERRSRIFLLVEGEVAVTVATDGVEREIARLRPGALFGLLALLDGLPASATCRAVGPVRVAVLTTTACSVLSGARAQIAYAFDRALGRQVARDFRRLVTPRSGDGVATANAGCAA